MNDKRVIIIIFLLTHQVYGIEDATNVNTTQLNQNDVYYVYPERTEAMKSDVILIYPENETTEPIITEATTQDVNIMEETTEAIVETTTEKIKVLDVKSQIYEEAKLRYKKRKRVGLKIKKRIKLDNVTADQVDDGDLLVSESQRKDDILDVMQFTLDDAVIPDFEHNNIEKESNGIGRQYQRETVEAVEKRPMKEHLLMWSGFMSEANLNKSLNDYLIIGPIPKMLPKYFKPNPDLFKDQLELPTM